MKAEQALSDMKVIRKRMGRVHIVLRGGRLTVMEPHPDRSQQIASITPTLAERPARRPWWSR
ncbi:MAG TPA: hypothetical protein VF048_06275 [Gemmatimonadaceae bacterium]|jgi:hypothetical protein